MIPISKPMIGQEEIDAVIKVLKSGMIAQGPKTLELEEKFAKYCGTSFGVAMNSGTAALHSILYALDIKEGDEVITTPFTFIASANTVLMQRAHPVLVDVSEDDFMIDPNKIEEKITKKTKAITTVDLYGQLCDYDKIEKIAKKHDLAIVEDACQAHGAMLGNKKAGTFGKAAAFSFYATKNMTCGEGGILTTNDKEIADAARVFRQHGRSKMTNYEYVDMGYNYRMTDITAAIALEQLKKIDEFNKKRNTNAKLLSEGLKKIKGIIVPKIVRGTHAFHQYTVRVTDEFSLNRDELIAKLSEKGINTAVYYPRSLNMTHVYQKRGYKEGQFPVAEKLCKEVLSLPVHPSLTEDQITEIITTVSELA